MWWQQQQQARGCGQVSLGGTAIGAASLSATLHGSCPFHLWYVCACRGSDELAASHTQQQTPLVGAGSSFRISRRLLTAADVQRAAALEPGTAAVLEVGSGHVPTSAASTKVRAFKKRNKSSRGRNKARLRRPGQHAAAATAAAEPKRAPAGTDWIAGLKGAEKRVAVMSKKPLCLLLLAQPITLLH